MNLQYRTCALFLGMSTCLWVPTVSAVSSRQNASFHASQWQVFHEGEGPKSRFLRGRWFVTIPPASRGKTFKALIERNEMLVGDFDARAHFRLLKWPSDSGAKLSLGTEEGSVQRVSEEADGGEVSLTDFKTDGVSGRTSTPGRTGWLRLVRRNNLLTGFRWSQGKWAAIHSVTLTETSAVHLHLAAWGHETKFAGKSVRIAFDQFYLK